MKKRIVTIALAVSVCFSSQSVAYAWQDAPLLQEDVLVEESLSGPVTREAECPSPAEAYEAMIALKDREEYKEGTTWTNDEPYSDSKGYYRWKGGPLGGANIVAVGCVAFSFILSDEAFGSLPARMYAEGAFQYEDIKVGDILRVNGDAHTVIVLEVDEVGVVVAEGNISTGDHKGKVHWGRAISKEEVMRTTSHYITRYPENYIPPDDPEANVSIANGTLDGGLKWNLTKAGTLSISGTGAMPDFGSMEEQPWIENSDKIRKIVIGDGVTNIGSYAFWNCGVLGVVISPSVTTIGNSAFRGSSIISVTIPSNVKTIGDSAFRECKNLSAVTFSEGLETISQNAFRSCESLTTIELPASIGEVGAAAFIQCQKLTIATFAPGSKQVKMGDDMFAGCYYLMKVTLPKSIDRISERMFQNCLTLAGVEIPQGAESIEPSAFASCTSFTTVIIPDSVTAIGMAAFSSCRLSDIYFTGTEAQWNSIGKSADVIAVLSKAKMHYNYTPPTSPDPGGDNPGGDNPGGDNPGGDNPGGDNPGGDNPGGDNPGGDNPGGDNPGGDNPGGDNPGGDNPGGDNPGGDNPGGDNPGGDNPGGDNPGGDNPGGDNPGGDNPGGDNPGGDNPGGDNPGGDNPGGDNPGGDNPGGDNPGGDNPGNEDNPGNVADISKATVTLTQTSYIYDGKPKTPSVIVKLDGKTLVLNTDYTISYSNNIKVGTATVTITGKGNYTGSKTASFTITKPQEPAASITCRKTVYEVAYGAKPFKINASSQTKMTFTSSKTKIAAVDKNTGKVTIKDTGVATITIKAGNATKKVTVKVNPKKQSIKAVKTVKGKKLTIKWPKDKRASGYQVQISTDKKFKKNLKSKKLSKTSYTFTKLKTGKKYYVRVRSYKKSGKDTLNGTWSKVKLSGKIKK